MKLYRVAALLVGLTIATSGMAQNAPAPKRSLDDIVNSADNPFKVRNAPKPTSDIETERMLMQMGRKAAPARENQCVRLSAEEVKSCGGSGNYLRLCLRSETLAAQNRAFCENYKRVGCANACKEAPSAAGPTAEEEQRNIEYMKSLSSPATNGTIDARANCLKRHPGQRRLCGYPN